MSKTTVAVLTADIKALIDYDIVDSDLDALILKGINLAIKRMKQWFMDEGLFDEIGTSDSFTTTASQNYIDIATETIDLDQPLVLSERTNDKTIPIIPYAAFIASYPDPTANKSATPDVAAFFGNRLYLGPTPSATGTTLYLDYIKLITKLVSGGTLPYEDKYDEVIIAIVIEYMTKWLDSKDRAAIQTSRETTLTVKHDLIVGAVKNIGMIQQRQSRRQELPYFSPRKVI